MKKFLSLVLALVMTMSLVTVSAGATEYKDFTDKDEIQYEEAVAVLNKLGIITGYSEGDFRPEGELTRGAAAKIIVSLLIGPTAAEALGNETSPYPDVPAGNTFAGVISYCKTANIISGYGDGTFRPTGTLTGYAFSKMLLGALGYKTEYEGFEGAGWNMNVARLGGEAGLFDRISFNGNEPVDRQTACQLALNTLKATEVEYSGGMNITTGDTSMVVKPERNYKVSSNKEINKNIFAGQPMAGGGNEYYTLEFGEEHFVDLKLTHEGDAVDSFGRPSNEWSFKKVTIGTFPIEPDFVYTTQVAHTDATNALKLRELGLGGFTVNYGYTDSNGNPKTEWTEVYVNGMRAECPDEKTFTTTDYYNYPMLDSSDGKSGLVAGIADLTDNGVTVEVYISDDVADWISHVVVTKTQLMEIRSVGSDYVALRGYDNGKSDDADPDKLPGTKRDTNGSFPGFNQMAINATLENVQSDDVCYSTLSALKAGDVVAVVPVNSDHDPIGTSGAEFYVADAYVPETVSGALTAVKDYGSASDKKAATNVTVGGTSYDVALWNKDLFNVTADIIKATKKDVTLYLDRNGNALLAKDIGATNDFMVVGAWRSAIENGRIVDIVTGWDISGNAIELNLGPGGHDDHEDVMPGDLVRYSSNSSNVAEWKISETIASGVYDVFTGVDTNGTGDDYKIKSSNVYIAVNNSETAVQVAETVTIDKNIKFIYVNFSEDDKEVESVEVKEGVQDVENTELKNRCVNSTKYNIAQAGVKDNAVKVVVIKGESNDAIATNMLYVTKFVGGAGYDSTGKMVYEYRVAMNGTGNRLVDGEDEKAIFSYDRLERGDFASYTAVENADHSEFYNLRRHNNFVNRTTATYSARIWDIVDVTKCLVALDEYTWVNGPVLNEAEPTSVADQPRTVELSQPHGGTLGIGNEQNIAAVKDAVFVDIRSASAKKSTGEITNWEDLKDVMMPDNSAVCTHTVKVHLIINDNPDNGRFRTAAMVVVYDYANDSPAATKASLDSAVVKGNTVAGTPLTPAGSTSVNMGSNVITVEDANSALASTFTYSGKKATLTYSGTGTQVAESTNGTLSWTGAIEANKNFTITVTPYRGTATAYTISWGTLKTADVVEETETWTWTGALEGDPKYSDLANDGGESGNASAVDGDELTMNWVYTGKDEDTKAQIMEAMAKLGWTSVKADKARGATNWKITGEVVGISGDPVGVSCILKENTATLLQVEVDNGKKVYVTNSSPKADDAAMDLQGNVREEKLNGDVDLIEQGDLSSKDVHAGSIYTSDAWTKVKPLTVNQIQNNSGVFTATVYNGSVKDDNKFTTDTDDKAKVEAGETVVVVLTVDTGKSLKNSNAASSNNEYANAATIKAVDTSNLKVTGIQVLDANGDAVSADDVTVNVATKTITFADKANEAVLLDEGAQVIITYTVGTGSRCAASVDMTSSNAYDITYDVAAD